MLISTANICRSICTHLRPISIREPDLILIRLPRVLRRIYIVPAFITKVIRSSVDKEVSPQEQLRLILVIGVNLL